MNSINAESRTNLLGRAADEFFAEAANGERPSIDEFAEKYPAIAEDIQRVFPALAVVGDSVTDGAASSLPQSLPCTRELGDFRILGELGRGGMGVVYEAEQLSIGRRVALKVLPFAGVLDQQQLNRFKNEARAAGTLDHPNIVSVFSVGSARGVHYYAMQLIEGQSLAEVITARQTATPRAISERAAAAGNEDPTVAHQPSSQPAEADVATRPVAALSTLPAENSREYFNTVARLGVQAAEALDHAHQNGILHRDVKPGNLLLDAEGKLYITDFGLARIEADAGMTLTGDILGTLRYMSPEQALAKRVVVDHRTDVYSLGVTLYELLASRPAFESVDRHELLKQIAFEEPKKLRQRNGRIPADLETIVHKAMEKDPADRYETARELADDLVRFCDDLPIRARRPSVLRPFQRMLIRHPIASVAISLLSIFVLLVVTAFAADNKRRVRDANQRAAEDVDVALAALGKNNLDRARDRSLQAIAQLRQIHADDSPIQSLAANVAEECRRYAQLIACRESARMIRSYEDPNLPMIEQGLSLYGVANDGRWLHDLRAAQLPATHIKRVSDTVYELLLARADHYLRWPERKEPEAAKKLLDTAISFHAPSRGYFWLLANYTYFTGDREKEKELRELAMKTPVHHAAELFYISRDHRWGSVSKHRGYPDYPFESVYQDCREMLRFDPAYYNSLFFMAHGLSSHERYEEALAAWYGCVSLRPNDNTALTNRANLHLRLGQTEEAIADYESAILNPAVMRTSPSNLAYPRNVLAWLMATHPEAKYRNGSRALKLAKEACELTDYEDGNIIDTLAAAHAEMGDFDSAIRWIKEAVSLVDDADVMESLEQHLQSFENGEPWRESLEAE